MVISRGVTPVSELRMADGAAGGPPSAVEKQDDPMLMIWAKVFAPCSWMASVIRLSPGTYLSSWSAGMCGR